MAISRISLLIIGISLFISSPLATQDCPLYLSTDQGDTWIDFSEGLPEDVEVSKIYEHEATLFLLTLKYGLFILPKAETEWKLSNQGLPTNDQVFHPLCLAANGDKLVMGTFGHGLFVSRDKGLSWRPSSSFFNEIIVSLYFDDDVLLAGTRNGLYQSSDHGDSQDKLGVAHEGINAISKYNDQIIIARQNGVGTLKDQQIHWSDFQSETAIVELLQHDGYLYALSVNGGIARSKTGAFWTSPLFSIIHPGTSLIDFIWRGTHFNPPGETPTGLIKATSRGWLVGLSTGC